MNLELLENNYIVVPGFIDRERAISLSEEFKLYCKENSLSGDSQVELSETKYDYVSFLELLCEKTPEISELIGETVLPTYTYARVYANGAVLKPHVDRKACEISLTVNLDCDIPWDICIETTTGEKRSITLNPGDAMIYLGCSAVHWRDKFEGVFCSQVFLHYVRSRGPYASVYFDKKKYEEAPDIQEVKELSDAPIQKNDPKVNTSTLIVNNNSKENIIYKSRTPLDQYIKVFYNILDDRSCDLILNEFSNSDDWAASMTGTGTVNKDIRNCDIIPLSQPGIINKNPEIRQQIDQLLFGASGKALKKYIEEFPDCDVNTDSGYDLLRYETGGYYLQHTDSFKDIPRTVSCSFNLNDDYVGGEFAFFDGEVIICAPKGSAIVFPSNFMYPHEIKEVKEGTRYSIVTWFL